MIRSAAVNTCQISCCAYEHVYTRWKEIRGAFRHEYGYQGSFLTEFFTFLLVSRKLHGNVKNAVGLNIAWCHVLLLDSQNWVFRPNIRVLLGGTAKDTGRLDKKSRILD